MRVAIMQPYFLPYIGYYQLIGAVDLFIVYDNIKYTKKGWINRNRMLHNGKDALFSLPLKSASDFLDVRDRERAADFNPNKLLNQISGTYHRAPYFEQTFPLLERLMHKDEQNLFRFIHNAILETCAHLGLGTDIRISSGIPIDHNLRNQDKVLALCEAVGASTYINTVGGMDLYAKDAFRHRGIDLKFIQSKPFEYAQFGNEFIPWLSIIDVMMFNPIETVQNCITSNYELL